MHRRALALSSVVALIGGCVVDNDGHDVVVGPGPIDVEVFEANIDTGVVLDAEPGEGAGAFIEYLGEGRWHVFVACDTTDPASACQWDVVVNGADPVTRSTAITGFKSDGLEVDDAVYGTSTGGVALQTFTDDTLDGFFFDTAPGEPIRIEVWLDGVLDPRFIYWPGDGVVHRGAPSDPLDLVPTEP